MSLTSGDRISASRPQERRIFSIAKAEISRLEKLEVKANQRLHAKYRDMVLASCRVDRSNPHAAGAMELRDEAERAEEAWDRAADERLGIVVRLLSVHRLLASME